MSRLGLGARLAATLAVALSIGLGAGPVAASEGSIPEEVASFASDPNALLTSLDDLAGVNANGQGLDFGSGAAVGGLHRIFGFTAGWLAGEAADPAVELRNEWAAPITIEGKPVGVAVIWINPGTVKPELADFIADIAMATAIPDIGSDAYLVRDEPRGAWFSLAGTDLTVIQQGASGVSGTAALASYQSSVLDEKPAQPSTGTTLAVPVAIIGAAALLVIVGVLVPTLRARRKQSL